MNLIEKQPYIGKIYLYAKDSYKTKYQYLTNIRKKVGLEHFTDPNTFMEYSNDVQGAYKNIDKYNTDKERKISIVLIADI